MKNIFLIVQNFFAIAFFLIPISFSCARDELYEFTENFIDAGVCKEENNNDIINFCSRLKEKICFCKPAGRICQKLKEKKYYNEYNLEYCELMLHNYPCYGCDSVDDYPGFSRGQNAISLANPWEFCNRFEVLTCSRDRKQVLKCENGRWIIDYECIEDRVCIARLPVLKKSWAKCVSLKQSNLCANKDELRYDLGYAQKCTFNIYYGVCTWDGEEPLPP